MPLFFILAGYTYVKYSKKDIKHYSLNRVKRLLISYFIYGLLTLFYWIFIERILRNQQDIPIIKPVLNLFFASGIKDGYVYNAVLWFIPCMLLTSLVFNFIYIYMRKYITYIICVIGVLYIIYGEYYTLHQDILIRLPWEIDAVGVTMLFYGVGGLISKIGRISFNKILNLIIYVVLTLLTVFITLNNSVDMAKLIYGNGLLFFMSAIFGSIGCCCLGIILKDVKGISQILKFLGVNSMTIMCIHEPLKRIIIIIFAKIIKLNNSTVRELPLTIVIISILTMIVCLVCVALINKFLIILKSKK